MVEKNKREIVNDVILVRFWISKILTFFKKKTIVLSNSLIKSRIDRIKQHKKFKNFLRIIDRLNRKKDVKNTKKSKSK